MFTASHMSTARDSRIGFGRAGKIAGAALGAILATCSASLAQCVTTYNFGGISTNGLLVPQASPLISIINTVNTAFITNTTSFVSAPGGAQPDQNSGGVWARGIAGTVDAKSDSTSTADLTQTVGLFNPAGGFLATGNLRCHQENRQDYAGVQLGADLAKLNLGGTGVSWHFGITGGDFYARAQEQTLQPNPLTPAFPTGDLKGTFQVPFIGFYNVFTAGNFFTDAQLRWDFYRSTTSSAAQHFSDVSGQAQGLSFTTSMGYRIPFASTWFIEPSVGGVLSQTKVDPIVTPWDGGNGTSTLRITDINSVLGRATVRVGTSFTEGTVTWQPFLTASVIHEFAGNVTSTQTISSATDVSFDKAVFTTETERMGTYTQIGFGTAVVIGNTGWLGYGRGDVKFGENVQGWGVNFGVRQQW
jgi:Autotransporter beta-domain